MSGSMMKPLMGGLQTAAGIGMTVMGQPELGVPMAMGGASQLAGSAVGGQTGQDISQGGGLLGSLGGMLGGGAGMANPANAGAAGVGQGAGLLGGLGNLLGAQAQSPNAPNMVQPGTAGAPTAGSMAPALAALGLKPGDITGVSTQQGQNPAQAAASQPGALSQIGSALSGAAGPTGDALKALGIGQAKQPTQPVPQNQAPPMQNFAKPNPMAPFPIAPQAAPPQAAGQMTPGGAPPPGGMPMAAGMGRPPAQQQPQQPQSVQQILAMLGRGGFA